MRIVLGGRAPPHEVLRSRCDWRTSCRRAAWTATPRAQEPRCAALVGLPPRWSARRRPGGRWSRSRAARAPPPVHEAAPCPTTPTRAMRPVQVGAEVTQGRRRTGGRGAPHVTYAPPITPTRGQPRGVRGAAGTRRRTKRPCSRIRSASPCSTSRSCTSSDGSRAARRVDFSADLWITTVHPSACPHTVCPRARRVRHRHSPSPPGRLSPLC
ncbi:hypothetical protein CMS1686 [Clavibacter sepedonicus]|uniref:Uncharacterized protein n=1 Tax=Clavibacter sepedonicus TaxID=31964 RepID=B0RCM7_CLASE|nr:hypothetical protein CMS1686 [Clavibacter sepedonicus]